MSKDDKLCRDFAQRIRAMNLRQEREKSRAAHLERVIEYNEQHADKVQVPDALPTKET